MNDEIHIGKMIRRKMQAERRKAGWLAKEIGCHTSNIYRIYNQQFPPTGCVNKICIVLEIDLYPFYSKYIKERIQEKNELE